MATESELLERIKSLEDEIRSERRKRKKMHHHKAFVDTAYKKAMQHLATSAASN
jgi:hypothetical protein